MSELHPQPGTTPTPLPTSAEFPVAWDDALSAERLWTRDRMHFPEVVCPALDSLFESHNVGFAHACDFYELPVAGMELRRINGYAYSTTVPRPMAPEKMATMAEKAQQNLRAAVPGVAGRWTNEFLPEVRTHLAYWQAFDLAGATLSELIAHAHETRQRLGRLWEIHFEVMVPTLLGISLFQETHADLFGEDRAFDALTLMQGFGNLTTEINDALYHLARTADDAVKTLILESDPSTVRGALQGSEAGARFLDDFDRYLQTYGRRSETWEVRHPSWLEDPTPVWRMLREHLVEGALDPSVELARLASQREAMLAEARAQLTDYPQPVVEHFEMMLAAAQQGTVVSEDHGYYIDFEACYFVRQVLLELGRRLAAAGVLNAADDVMMLTPDEVLATAEALPGLDRRALVAERQREMAHFAKVDAPPQLGTLPPGPPPDDAVGRALGRFFGTPPQASPTTDLLNGHAGSPGLVRGLARIVRTLAEAQAIQRGEILVAPMTSPSWTPLFGKVAGIVTDTGGVLSHSAVVAREYGLPAVVGTQNATKLIQDGQLIEVDGRAGTVRLIERTPSPA